jgi:putative addiction module component (TIGR02574 family)
MKQITATDTLALSIPERIQLVEDIWDTIASTPDEIDLTEEEKRIIDERLESYHKNPALGSPWEDVCKRVSAKE